MTERRTPFQNRRKLFAPAFEVLKQSDEYRDAAGRTDKLLCLGDRVLAACQGDPAHSAVAQKVSTNLRELDDNNTANNNEKLFEISKSLAEAWEPWCKAIIWLVLPEVWNGRQRSSNLYHDVVDLKLFSPKELEAIKPAKDIDDPLVYLRNATSDSNDYVRILMIVTYLTRNLVHGGREAPQQIRNEQPKAALVAYLVTLAKYEQQIRDRLLDLIPSSCEFDTELQALAQQVDSERRSHTERFQGRREDLDRLTKLLLEEDVTDGRYLLVRAAEGVGKSALAAQLTEELKSACQTLGPRKTATQKDAPWLPGAIVHFGKCSNDTDEIVRFLLHQINSLLLKPLDISPTSPPGEIVDEETAAWPDPLLSKLVAIQEHLKPGVQLENISPKSTEDRGWDFRSPTGYQSSGSDDYGANLASATEAFRRDVLSTLAIDHPPKSKPLASDTKLRQRRLLKALDQLAKERGRAILILDACDEIASEGKGLDFLPERLPVGVVVVLTCRDGNPVQQHIERKLRPTDYPLDFLDRDAIPLVTGVNDNKTAGRQFNDRVYKETDGLALLVSEIGHRVKQTPDFEEVEITGIKAAFHERQANEWTNEPHSRILPLLAIFERIGSLRLSDVQRYLETCAPERPTLPQLRRLLGQRNLSEQLHGLLANKVKLAVKTYADYLCNKHFSELDLQDHLQAIVTWLAEDERIAKDLLFDFLRAWALPESQACKELRDTSLMLCERLAQHQRWGMLRNIARRLYSEGETGQSLATRCLELVASGKDPKAMAMLGTRLLDGRGLERDPKEGRRWLTKAAEADSTIAMHELGNRLLDGRGLKRDPEEGRRWLTKAAESDEPIAEIAMHELGSRLLDGRGLERDPKEGRRWLTKAAEADSTIAMHELGNRLLDGKGLERDTEEGRRWLTKAAEADDTNAMRELGSRLLDGKGLERDTEEGRRWLTKAAEADHPNAMAILGSRLLEGDGLEHDSEEGRRWLTKAAEADHPNAMCGLGNRLLDGRGLKRDPEEGRRWLTKAAESDEPIAEIAMHELGSRLLDGRGLERDPEEGRRWLTKAAEADYTMAMAILGNRLLEGDGLERDPEEGRRWLTKAAEADNTNAMGAIGIRLLDGWGLERDPKEGRRWLTKAAEADHPNAMCALGSRLLDGWGLERDPKEGRRWLTKAAEADHPNAMCGLGDRLLDGDGLERDTEEGRHWLTKAAEADHPNAMCGLGDRLLDGDGLERDTEEGRHWLTKAAEADDTMAMAILGNRLLDGDGLERDTEEGRHWLTKAAEADDTMAMLALVNRLLAGRGLKRDPEEGRRWLTKAAESDEPKATIAMRELGDRLLDGDGLERDPEEGRHWLTKAAEGDSTLVMNDLGNRLLDGRGLKRDPEEGRRWLTKAAESDEPIAEIAMHELGSRLLDGRGLERDPKEGRRWLTKAAEADEADSTIAMHELGNRLLDGKGLERDTEEGRRWLTKAAEADDTNAMRELGSRLLDGKGLERDTEEGRRWLTKAAEADCTPSMAMLGFRLLDGDGLERDTEEGRRWLTKAAEARHVGANTRMGFENYLEKNFGPAATLFVQILENPKANQEDAGEAANNLLFMLRRDEVPSHIAIPAIEKLIETAERGGPTAFVLVNKVLCYAAGAQGIEVDWKTADRLVAQLKTEWDPAVLDWWKDLADSETGKDRGEGCLVLAWIARHGIADDPDGYPVAERLQKASAEGWDVPKWMFDSLPDAPAT